MSPAGAGLKEAGEEGEVRLRVVIGFILLLIASSSGAEERPQVGGFFSNIRYTSGDVIGTAVWIVRSE